MKNVFILIMSSMLTLALASCDILGTGEETTISGQSTITVDQKEISINENNSSVITATALTADGFADSITQAVIADTTIAEATISGSQITIIGKSSGNTILVITSSSNISVTVTITVTDPATSSDCRIIPTQFERNGMTYSCSFDKAALKYSCSNGENYNTYYYSSMQKFIDDGKIIGKTTFHKREWHESFDASVINHIINYSFDSLGRVSSYTITLPSYNRIDTYSATDWDEQGRPTYGTYDMFSDKTNINDIYWFYDDINNVTLLSFSDADTSLYESFDNYGNTMVVNWDLNGLSLFNSVTTINSTQKICR